MREINTYNVMYIILCSYTIPGSVWISYLPVVTLTVSDVGPLVERLELTVAVQV